MSSPGYSLPSEGSAFETSLVNSPLQAGWADPLLDDDWGDSPLTTVYPPLAYGLWKGVWNWMTLSFACACTTSGLAIAAFNELIQLPPEIDCATLSGQSSDRALLHCAKVAADTGQSDKLAKAVAFLGSWNCDRPLYAEAQGLLAQWSETLLQRAQKYASVGRLAAAIRLVEPIPPSSPHYGTARSLLRQWQTVQRSQGLALYSQGQEALRQKDWAGAIQFLWQLRSLEGDRASTGLSGTFARELETERQAQRQWVEAVDLAASENIEKRGEAIAIASQMDPHTYTARDTQAQLNRWSDDLLAIALERWYEGDLPGAQAIARQVTSNPQRRRVAQDLIMLAESRHLALLSLNTEASFSTAVGLYPAILIGQTIAPDSPLRPQATSNAQTWQARLNPSPDLQQAISDRALAPEAWPQPRWIAPAPLVDANTQDSVFNPAPFVR